MTGSPVDEEGGSVGSAADEADGPESSPQAEAEPSADEEAVGSQLAEEAGTSQAEAEEPARSPAAEADGPKLSTPAEAGSPAAEAGEAERSSLTEADGSVESPPVETGASARSSVGKADEAAQASGAEKAEAEEPVGSAADEADRPERSPLAEADGAAGSAVGEIDEAVGSPSAEADEAAHPLRAEAREAVGSSSAETDEAAGSLPVQAGSAVGEGAPLAEVGGSVGSSAGEADRAAGSPPVEVGGVAGSAAGEADGAVGPAVGEGDRAEGSPPVAADRAVGSSLAAAVAAVRSPLVKAAGVVRPPLGKAAAAVGPGLGKAVAAVRPGLGKAVRAVKPGVRGVSAYVVTLKEAVRPQAADVSARRTLRYSAGAAGIGLVLAVGAATVAGPWDSSGQRTAERERAGAIADHGRGSAGTTGQAPKPAPSALSVLTGLGSAAGTAKAPAPATGALTAVLGPLLADPALVRHAAAVVDVSTGKLLYGSGATTPLTPASTTKIATAVAALSAMGPDHRFVTRAALEPDTRELVLVGGGDPTLTARADAQGWASLRTLAKSTAAALKKRGLTDVTISYDTTLYVGPDRHPIGKNPNLARVVALTADEGRPDDSTSGAVERVPDPAQDATAKFAGFLEAEGVRTKAPGPSKATSRAQTLATVSSPPLPALVERMLTNSDNDIAEALARQTALATGVRPDFAGAGEAITAQLKKLGLPVAGVSIKDGSGLDRSDRLTPALLAALLTTSANPAHPNLRPVLTGLPVAGFTGTLSTRYSNEAAGVVRAKTGTLTGVNALAGTVVDREGRQLAFAFLASDTTDPDAAQAALDRTASALANCGCA
ncbi:D-alanyl-D-alanine carboxypeptidase/D-alanyl-D-alanine-endopeptidase [Streptomyces acidiscabies]|uniref:D-alanyl-D-alanine carboxypeptidase/D-alanyl-D-alanine endopeptidase n=2 Tax=Streptomyces acidiscabies TaxID=42234 RepID=UPI00030598D4|nr:D-alanyl-D-alanine carboxypeptidase/D-alanyl-D-alanine-endopeptidase [Streptomyces acidiscabies]